MSRYQKGKTNLDFTEARGSEWQWHQLGRMQVCTSLQTDNHASTPPPNQQRQSTEGTEYLRDVSNCLRHIRRGRTESEVRRPEVYTADVVDDGTGKRWLILGSRPQQATARQLIGLLRLNVNTRRTRQTDTQPSVKTDHATRQLCAMQSILLLILQNEYYFIMPWSQKKLQEHLITAENKTNDSVTQDKKRSKTVRDQMSG